MTFLRTLLVALVLTLCAGLGRAEDAAGRVPVKVVGGRLVVACDLSTETRRIPANLFVEFETRCGLQLHNRAAQGIRAEVNGQRLPITLNFPGFKVTVPNRELGPEQLYEDFSKYHSVDIGETAVVGTIGTEILRNHHVVLDLDAGFLHLAPPLAEGAGASESLAGGTEVTASIEHDMVWLPVTLPDGEATSFALTTSRFDTILERAHCDRRGKPAGDVGAVMLGDIDIAQYVAFRPEEVVYKVSRGAGGLLGLGFLRHFRVEIDRTNSVVRLLPTAAAAFPDADLAFFRALIQDDPSPLRAYLEAHPDSRLAGEAAERQLELLIEEDADPEELLEAVKWIDRTQPEDLRTTAALDRMKELAAAGHEDVAITVAELGIESGRKDRYPDAVHKVHGKVGELLLDRGLGKRAWKHLLSAAFGMADDGMVNLNLGRYYEKQERWRRAFSRYVQAAIKPESGPQALEGLARVQEATGGEAISVDRIERLIEGKVMNFTAATKFEPTEENSSGRVVLLEYFTNAHIEQGGLGGTLANEGLLTHFPRENVAALTYHVPSPSLEPLVSEVAVQRMRQAFVGRPSHRINGDVAGGGLARTSDKEQLYEELRAQVLDELKRPTEYAIELEAAYADGVISGDVTVSGPVVDGRFVHVILAERGVLFPGKSKVVVHRMVARASLTDGLDGEPYELENVEDGRGSMSFSFSRALADVTAANERFLDDLARRGAGTAIRVSTQLDPAQLTVVAFIREPLTGRVLQAIQFDVEPPAAAEHK